ncbi:MAG: hypothetical protein AAFR76_14135 [Planctomycetota bacterium]
MRKRIGPRELGAAALIVGIAVVYWMQPAAPRVTVASGEQTLRAAEGTRP